MKEAQEKFMAEAYGKYGGPTLWEKEFHKLNPFNMPKMINDPSDTYRRDVIARKRVELHRLIKEHGATSKGAQNLGLEINQNVRDDEPTPKLWEDNHDAATQQLIASLPTENPYKEGTVEHQLVERSSGWMASAGESMKDGSHRMAAGKRVVDLMIEDIEMHKAHGSFDEWSQMKLEELAGLFGQRAPLVAPEHKEGFLEWLQVERETAERVNGRGHPVVKHDVFGKLIEAVRADTPDNVSDLQVQYDNYKSWLNGDYAQELPDGGLRMGNEDERAELKREGTEFLEAARAVPPENPAPPPPPEAMPDTPVGSGSVSVGQSIEDAMKVGDWHSVVEMAQKKADEAVPPEGMVWFGELQQGHLPSDFYLCIGDGKWNDAVLYQSHDTPGYGKWLSAAKDQLGNPVTVDMTLNWEDTKRQKPKLRKRADVIAEHGSFPGEEKVDETVPFLENAPAPSLPPAQPAVSEKPVPDVDSNHVQEMLAMAYAKKDWKSVQAWAEIAHIKGV